MLCICTFIELIFRLYYSIFASPVRCNEEINLNDVTKRIIHEEKCHFPAKRSDYSVSSFLPLSNDYPCKEYSSQ